jgi:hypothetical protein
MILNVDGNALINLRKAGYGVNLCWEAGYRKLTCYSNSLHVVQLVRMRLQGSTIRQIS